MGEVRVHKLTFYSPLIEKLAPCFKGKAYLVGGFVRDRLLGRRKERIDVDLVVSEGLEETAECIRKVLSAKPFFFEKEKKVASFVGNGWRIDLSEIAGKNIEEDLRKRDFTINALAVDVDELFLPFNDDAVVIDPFGGFQDLARGVLRPVTERRFLCRPMAGSMFFESHPNSLIPLPIPR